MDTEHQVFLDMTPYNIADKYSYFVETYHPNLECHLLYSEAEGSKLIQKAGNYLKDKQHHIPEGSVLHTAIHSFSILSDDRSKASSKTIPPHNAI